MNRPNAEHENQFVIPCSKFNIDAPPIFTSSKKSLGQKSQSI